MSFPNCTEMVPLILKTYFIFDRLSLFDDQVHVIVLFVEDVRVVGSLMSESKDSIQHDLEDFISSPGHDGLVVVVCDAVMNSQALETLHVALARLPHNVILKIKGISKCFFFPGMHRVLVLEPFFLFSFYFCLDINCCYISD